MKVPYGEGVAIHTGPELCGGVREGMAEDVLWARKSNFIFFYNSFSHRSNRLVKRPIMDLNWLPTSTEAPKIHA